MYCKSYIFVITFYKYHIEQQQTGEREDKNLYYTTDNGLSSLTIHIHYTRTLHFPRLELSPKEYAYHIFDIFDISKKKYRQC